MNDEIKQSNINNLILNNLIFVAFVFIIIYFGTDIERINFQLE